jgi:hypothetical protein
LKNKSVGLVVQEMQDVTEQDLRMESPRQASMLTGSAIIHDHVTDLLDVGSLVSSLQNSRISVPA